MAYILARRTEDHKPPPERCQARCADPSCKPSRKANVLTSRTSSLNVLCHRCRGCRARPPKSLMIERDSQPRHRTRLGKAGYAHQGSETKLACCHFALGILAAGEVGSRGWRRVNVHLALWARTEGTTSLLVIFEARRGGNSCKGTLEARPEPETPHPHRRVAKQDVVVTHTRFPCHTC